MAVIDYKEGETVSEKEYEHDVDCFMCGNVPAGLPFKHYWNGLNQTGGITRTPVCSLCYKKLHTGEWETGINSGGCYVDEERENENTSE